MDYVLRGNESKVYKHLMSLEDIKFITMNEIYSKTGVNKLKLRLALNDLAEKDVVYILTPAKALKHFAKSIVLDPVEEVYLRGLFKVNPNTTIILNSRPFLSVKYPSSKFDYTNWNMINSTLKEEKI